jgi:hypothetical protein
MPSTAPRSTQRSTRYILQDPCNLNIFKRHTSATIMRPALARERQAPALEHISHGLLERLASKMDRLELLKD